MIYNEGDDERINELLEDPHSLKDVLPDNYAMMRDYVERSQARSEKIIERLNDVDIRGYEPTGYWVDEYNRPDVNLMLEFLRDNRAAVWQPRTPGLTQELYDLMQPYITPHKVAQQYFVSTTPALPERLQVDPNKVKLAYLEFPADPTME